MRPARDKIIGQEKLRPDNYDSWCRASCGFLLAAMGQLERQASVSAEPGLVLVSQLAGRVGGVPPAGR